MKRMLLLAGILSACLLTNLSFRVPTTVEAQAGCVTGNAPTFTYGDLNQLFYLGTQLQFSSTSAGASFFSFSEASTASFGIFPGFGGTTGLGFSATNPSATATALSCQDSPWDITFSLAGTGTTALDTITIFLVQPNGSGRRTLAQFVVNANNTEVTLTGLAAGVSIFGNGHVQLSLLDHIPYNIAAGTSGLRSDLITIALPMNGTFQDCNLIGVDIQRGAGAGKTTVGFVNIQVARMGSPVIGKSVQGITGSYPTGLKCAVYCPPCIACNSGICYYDPQTWCTSIQTYPGRYTEAFVVIPNDNFGQPIRVVWNGFFGLQPSLAVLFSLCDGIGKKSVADQLLARYIAAQLSLQTQLPFYYAQLGKQQLACNWMAPMAMMGMPAAPAALPVTLSTGVTLSGASTLQDLFNATNTAIKSGNVADQTALLAIYLQLNACKKD